MRHILTYLKPYRGRMAIGLLYKIAGTLSELLLPFLLTYILERVILREELGPVIFYGVLMLVFSVVACLGNIIANRMASRVATDFSRTMRRELFARTLSLSARDTDRFTIPSLESRITTDTYNVHNFIGMMQRMGVRAPTLLLGGGVITLWMDPALALVMIATLPLIFFTVLAVSRRGVPLYVEVQKSVDGMVRVAREDIQGIRVIKALSKNDYENRRYDHANRVLSQKERRAGVVMGSVNPIMTLLMNLGIAGVVALAAYRVIRGLSSAATVIAFMQYFTLISMAMMSLSRMFVMYTKCAASARRISEVILTPDDFTVTPCERREEEAHLVLEGVRFSYLGKQDNLTDISLSLARGGSLGVIGATGSGKSTLVKLLLRFYEPDAGEIRLDGRALTSYSREELSACFGVALQNDFIYADTIEENIRFGRSLSDEQVRRAARIAQAEDFITAFEDGYQHKLASKGTNVSGGQRQRILIARAIAANPSLLILDDSSSALDYKTDAALRRALKEEMAGVSVITVAQRISSVMSCDRILVLERGRAIGYGTHEELLRDCAPYREIRDSQMGGAFLD